MLNKLKKELKKLENKEKAKLLSNFFKTGKGEYGEGDKFLGITVPCQRKVAKRYRELNLKDIQNLLDSDIHEFRLVATLILVDKFKDDEKKIYDFYLKNVKRINNWDLVDLSCHKIIGPYLIDKDRSVLYKLAKSNNLWERRIAVVSTYYFIKRDDFKDIIKLSELLLNDKHDLIHKATGWMLREVGKKDVSVLYKFLDKYYKKMPRTMLRYSIERLDIKKKTHYMRKI